jgi:hypothetical protein
MQGNVENWHRFINEVQRLEEAKQDFVVDTRSLTLTPTEDEHEDHLYAERIGTLPVRPYAWGQIADRLQIPRKFFSRLGSEYRDLRRNLVNGMWEQKPERRLLRTLDGSARAYLSDRYRTIDHAFVLGAAVPELPPNVSIESQSLTDERMYVQITWPGLEGEVVPGDVVRAGITLTNSEVGAGTMAVRSMIWRLVCRNGMVGGMELSKRHTGARIDLESEQSYDIFQDDTIKAEMESLRLRMRDIVAAALTEAVFRDQLDHLRELAGQKVERPVATVENVTKRFQIPEAANEKLLTFMSEDAGFNRWGLVNAVTSYAQEIEDRNEQFRLETVGGEIAGMSAAQWRDLVAV